MHFLVGERRWPMSLSRVEYSSAPVVEKRRQENLLVSFIDEFDNPLFRHLGIFYNGFLLDVYL